MIRDKVIVVTGATSGIGVLIARRFAAKGAIPVLCGRSEQRLAAAAASISGRCGSRRLDVTDNEAVQAVMDSVLREFGRIDVLINNAGFGLFKTFADSTVQEFESMMDTNYMGLVRCTKAVLPSMLDNRSGHIINIASLAGKLATPKSSGYSASKHAVVGLTDALRQEVRGRGIFVSAVNPGPIDTPFFDQADPDGSYVKNVSWLMLKPEKVADRIVHLVEKPRAELDLPWLAAAGARLYRLFPRLADRIAGPMLNKK